MVRKKWYHKLFEKKKTQPIRLRPRVRLHLETLEDLAVPASFTVTSTADDGSAETLRSAIDQANASGDATNTINFSLLSGPQTIVLTQGALALNNSHSTTIQGTGANQLFISGNNSSGVISIGSGATVELDDLTIEDGSATDGAGIYNTGKLTINDCTVSGNTATIGGRIDNSASPTLSYCTLSGNNASSRSYGGGALANYATATVTYGTFTKNSAAASGGAVWDTAAGSLVASDCTFNGNTSFDGGTILDNDSSTVVTLTNSTFSQNTAFAAGGAVYSDNGTFSLAGGDVHISKGSSGITLTGSNDLIDDTSAGTNASNGYFGAASLYDVAAGLDPNGLQNNGGPTETIALSARSPALNGGSNALIPAGVTTDQRGPGYSRIFGSSADIGAYEAQQFTPIVSVADAGGTYNGSAYPATSATVTGVPPDGIIASFGDPSLSYLYYQNGAPLSEPPSAAGTYALVAHFAGNANYSAADSAEVGAPASPGDPLGQYGNSYGYRYKSDLVHEVGKSMASVTAIDVLDMHYFDGPRGSFIEPAPAGSPYSYLIRNKNDGASHDVTLGVVEATAFTISPATPTVSVSDGGTYNGNPFAATGTALGVDGKTAVSGSFSYAYYVGTSASGTSTSTAPTNAATYTVVATFTSNDNNYASGITVQTTFTIDPLAVTLSGNRVYDGTTTASASILTAINIIRGDSLSLSGSAALAGADAGTENISDVSGLSLSGSSSSNYTLTGATGSVSIGQARPTMPFPTVPSNAVYNGQPQGASVGDVAYLPDVRGAEIIDLGAPTLTYYAGIYTQFNFPSSGGSSTPPTDVGSYAVVASYAGNTDFLSASSMAPFAINPAPTTTTLSSSSNPSEFGHRRHGHEPGGRQRQYSDAEVRGQCQSKRSVPLRRQSRRLLFQPGYQGIESGNLHVLFQRRE